MMYHSDAQIYLNNLDTAASYTSRLLSDTLTTSLLPSTFFLSSELRLARTSLSTLRTSEDKFRSVLKTGLDHLFNQLVRPRLRPLLSEVYRDVGYRLDEDGYADAEYRDEVRKRFVRCWEGLVSGYRVRPFFPCFLTFVLRGKANRLNLQDALTETNFNLFFATVVNVLVRPWESMIRGMKFTEVRPFPPLFPLPSFRADPLPPSPNPHSSAPSVSTGTSAPSSPSSPPKQPSPPVPSASPSPACNKSRRSSRSTRRKRPRRC